MASFSGRTCELEGVWNHNIFARSTVFLPTQHGLRRIHTRPRALSCNALALRNYTDLPVIKSLLKLLRLPQETHAPSEYSLEVGEEEGAVTGNQTPRSLTAALKGATLTAFQVGLTLTGAALHLASKVVAGLQLQAKNLASRNRAEQQSAEARQVVAAAQTQIQYEMQRQCLEKQGKDAAFVKMLHVLDRCHLDHDVKWALVQKHTADKAEFSERLSQLYNLAQASKDAVDHLLRPDASRQEINTFWKSPETVAIIAEEDKLKSLVFAQMLQASTP